jgi:hypothetical protein
MYSNTGPVRTTGLATGLLRFAQRARFALLDWSFGRCALPDCFGVKFLFPPCECLFLFWFELMDTGLVEVLGVWVELGAAHMISPL